MSSSLISESAAQLLGYLIGFDERQGTRQFMVVGTFDGITLIGDPTNRPIDEAGLDELHHAGLIRLQAPEPSGARTGYVTEGGKRFHTAAVDRGRGKAVMMEGAPPTVFIRYSHEDSRWMTLVTRHLSVLEMEGLLDVWSDERIGAGEDWFNEIEAAMERARAAILLVSAAFLRSRFVRSVEIPQLLERRAKEGLPIIPLLVRPCPWDKAQWLSRMQMRSASRALSGLTPFQRDTQLTALADELHAALVKSARPRPASQGPETPSGVLVIVKQIADHDGKVLGIEDKDVAGFGFEVAGPDGYRYLAITGGSGTTTIGPLKPGNYSVRERNRAPFTFHNSAVDGVPVHNGQAFPVGSGQTRQVIFRNRLGPSLLR